MAVKSTVPLPNLVNPCALLAPAPSTNTAETIKSLALSPVTSSTVKIELADRCNPEFDPEPVIVDALFPLTVRFPIKLNACTELDTPPAVCKDPPAKTTSPNVVKVLLFVTVPPVLIKREIAGVENAFPNTSLAENSKMPELLTVIVRLAAALLPKELVVGFALFC